VVCHGRGVVGAIGWLFGGCLREIVTSEVSWLLDLRFSASESLRIFPGKRKQLRKIGQWSGDQR